MAPLLLPKSGRSASEAAKVTLLSVSESVILISRLTIENQALLERFVEVASKYIRL